MLAVQTYLNNLVRIGLHHANWSIPIRKLVTNKSYGAVIIYYMGITILFNEL